MEQLSYPPCKINIFTDKPFTRHLWEITGVQAKKIKKKGTEEIMYFYTIRCSRCGLNNPKPQSH